MDGAPPVPEFREISSSRKNVRKNDQKDNESEQEKYKKLLLDKLETYEERLTATEERLDANEARIRKYSRNLLKVARNINILYGRFNWARDEITGLYGLEERVDATEQVMGNRDEEITVIKDIVESLNQSFNDLDDIVNDNNSSISDLNSRVKNQEKTIRKNADMMSAKMAGIDTNSALISDNRNNID